MTTTKIKYSIKREGYKFECSHRLSHLDYDSPCKNLHGHSYKVFIKICARSLDDNGMVIDFVILKKIVRERVIDKFDHQCLNDFFENPTAENVAVWIWDQLADLSSLLKAEKDNPNLPEEIAKLLKEREGASKEISTDVSLYEVELFETEKSSVKYRGE